MGSSFVVGDRVICKDYFAGEFLPHKMGTIVSVSAGDGIAVEFDEAFEGGHTCGGLAEDGHGRYGEAHEVTLVVDEPLEITLTFEEVIGLK